MVHVMSEIERYDCEEDRSCEYEVKAVMQVNSTGYYVRHADHLVYLNEMRLDRDAQRLRADTAEAELKDTKEGMAYRGSLFGKVQSERDDYERKLADAEQRIADRDALLRSTSVRLWNAHLALNRLIELEPAHKVKLLTDTIHTLAYAHKCIDIPHWDAALNQKTEGESHEIARNALKMENQRITPARFKCLACGDYHEGSGNLPCPKMAAISVTLKTGSYKSVRTDHDQ